MQYLFLIFFGNSASNDYFSTSVFVLFLFLSLMIALLYRYNVAIKCATITPGIIVGILLCYVFIITFFLII